MTGTKLRFQKVERRSWREGEPIDKNKPKILIRIQLDYIISHDEYFELKRNLHEADVENIRNLKNPETPFLLKDMEHTATLLEKAAYPPKFIPQLERSAREISEAIRHTTWRSKIRFSGLEEKLEETEMENAIFLRARFLEPEEFRKVASIVQEAGGNYVQIGKESHFLIPKKLQKESATKFGLERFM